MKGVGLVFAGGGGKGAYEIGVWKYLHEIGLDKQVKAVSGTSVGALNAALFIGASFEKAEELWSNIEPYMILTPKYITKEDIAKWLINKGIEIASEGTIKQGLKSGLAASYIYKRLFSDCCFSREGLQQMIKKGLDINMINNSPICCYSTCLKVAPYIKRKRFLLNDYNESDITKILLASSAIPLIFEKEYFNGSFYYDGGIPILGDNIPIQPLYDLGLDYIFVIHLKQDKIIEKDNYPNSKIREIVPRESLGNLIDGTLDFTPKGAKKRIDIGYYDAKRIIGPMVDMIMLGVEEQVIFKNAQKNQIDYENKMGVLDVQENRIKERMKNDGFDVLHDKLLKGNQNG